MKNTKILLAGILPLFTLITVSCGGNGGGDANETVLCSFENGYQDFNTAILINDFGRLSPNYVTKYVKTGKGSALLEPVGTIGTKAKPLVYFPMASNIYDFNKSNIKLYDSVAFSMYNASDKDITGAVGFIASVTSIYKVDTTKVSEFTLKAGQWNDFTLTIDHAHCNLFFNIEETPGLYFEFENQNVSDPAFAPKIYLDDVKFINAKEPHIIQDDFILDENEICDFEKDFQKYFLSCSNVFEDALTFSILEDFEGIKASQGKKFLCIDVKARGAIWENWSSVFLTELYMTKTQLSKIDLPEEAEQYRFVYDVCFVGSEDSAGQNRVVTRFYNRGMSKTTITVPCFDETKPLDPENIVCPETRKWYSLGFTFCKDYEFAGSTLNVDTNYTGVNTGRFEFSIGNLEKDYKILIDNIRLEKIAK